MLRLICLLLCWIPLAGYALPREADVPGGVAIVNLEAPPGVRPQATFHGERVAVVRDLGHWYAVVGIPLSTEPGRIHLSVKVGNNHFSRSIVVSGKAYKAQHITIKNRRQVVPNKRDMRRIVREKTLKDKARGTWSRKRPSFHLVRPVHGTVTSTFGLRRFFNGKPRAPHNGIDIAAPEGTPIRAAADGTVIRTGNFFFSGKLVYLDHGEGLISVYIHLSRIEVQPGQRVDQGERIGELGMTGRATGPNLHWGVYLNQTPVDPALFIADGRQ